LEAELLVELLVHLGKDLQEAGLGAATIARQQVELAVAEPAGPVETPVKATVALVALD
jgi:hypothetical protein